MRLKSIFAKDVCDFGASISRGVLLVGAVWYVSSSLPLLAFCTETPLRLPVAAHFVLKNTAGKC